jgi:ABC-type Co2+ transport system permease subunit
MEYEYVKKLYYDNIYNLKNIEENLQMVFYSVIAFFIPFVLGHPQILVGTIVNALLILGATYLRGHKLLPIILLPSIGVITAGVIFGNYTIYLLYMMPLIWIGNALYVYVYKHFNMKGKKLKNNFIGLGVASIIKTVFLFSFAFLLVQLSILPAMFLTVMGLFQLATAIMGGILAIGIVKARERIITNSN